VKRTGRARRAAGAEATGRRADDDGSAAGSATLIRPDLLAAGAVFLGALAVRLVYISQIDSAGLGRYLRLDPLYYHQWGLRIAAGEWIGNRVFEMSPLYAYLLGILYRIFGDGPAAPRLFQCLVASTVCALLVLVGRRHFGRAQGILAGAALALYGPAIFYDGQVMKTSFEISFTALMSFALLRASRGAAGPRPWWLFAGGLLLGLTALMRENILVAAPIFFVWAIWPREGFSPRKGLVAGAALTIGTILPIAPFTARNIAVAGEYVLITSLGGENFYTGNNPVASGRYTPPPFVRPDPRYEHEDFRREAARRAGRELTRREANSYWFDEGVRFILADPAGYLRLLWDKLTVFFNDFERPDNFAYENFRLFSPLLGAPLVHFAWVAPLGLLGIGLSLRRWRELLPLHITLAAFVASALIFFTQSRYRMPVVPILCLFGAHAVVRLSGAVRGREWRMLLWSAPLLALLGIFVTGDPGNTPLFEAQNQALIAEMHLEGGRLTEAAGAYRRSIEEIERLPMTGMAAAGRVKANAHLGLARTLLRAGDRAGGIEQMRLASRSPRPEVRFNALMALAALFGEDGDLPAAEEALHRAAGENRDDYEARMMHAEVLERLGRRREAIAELDEALRIRPGDPDASRIRAVLAGASPPG
jgi:4-amino-4-deoxy-L-arabinose transferase-like glycosyltransferase